MAPRVLFVAAPLWAHGVTSCRFDATRPVSSWINPPPARFQNWYQHQWYQLQIFVIGFDLDQSSASLDSYIYLGAVTPRQGDATLAKTS